MFFQRKKTKICVALSGGVDSSVAAYILKKKGYDVFGIFARGYNVDGCQDREAHDARRVAQELKIPFYVLDFENEYYDRIVRYLLDGYAQGITPNPDVLCNSEIKFGLLYDAAIQLGADAVASGHYARVERASGIGIAKHKIPRYYVRAGKDTNKDQSYFLWRVPRERFSRILFPIGGLKKTRVRAIARKAGLFTATKKDSQGICFLGKFSFVDFLKKHIPHTTGDVLDTKGRKVGTHDGAVLYTLGQRHGFNNSMGREVFVVRRDVQNNILIVAPEGDDLLYTDSFRATQLNFLDTDFEQKLRDGKKLIVFARVRYRQPLFKAEVSLNGNMLTVLVPNKNDQYKLFPTEGQSAVFYNKRGIVLGGGVISH